MNAPSRSSSGLLRRPIFADPIVQWRADLVYPMCWAALLAAVGPTVVAVIYLGEPTLASWATLLLAAPILGAIALTRRGRLRIASWFLVAAAYGLITAAAIWFTKATDVVHLYAMATLIAGLVLGGEALVLLAALGTGLVILLVHAEAQGWMPPPIHPSGLYNTIIALVVGVVMAAWIVSRVIATVRRARTAWETSNAELKAVLSTLEETVQQRTAALRKTNARLHDEVGVRSLIQADLMDARDEAEAGAKAKTRFVANVSHEIRTPLNGILGVTDLLGLEDLPIAARRHVDTIRTSGELMLALVDDVLDFSRLEADRVELEAIDFNLAEVMNAALAPIRMSVRRKNIALELDVAEATPRRLRGDPRRLSQVLANLAGNAVKFTPEGTVRVHVVPLSQDADGVEMRFRVEDTGLGMSTDAMRQVFEPFFQGDASNTRRFGGAGLGLSICKQLVQRMGGEISVSSQLGRGSTFEVTLRFDIPKSHRSDPRIAIWTPSGAGPSLSVLVAEDNPINQKVIVAMLERLGHRSTLAADGESALERLAEAAFDVVLMDCQMPRMDGVEACRILRATPGPNRLVPVVALTAHDSPEQRRECADAGMDSFLAKPARLEALAATLGQLAGAKHAEHIPPAPALAGIPAAATELDPKALAELRALETVRAGLLAEIARIYLDKALPRIEAIEHADSPESRASAAHVLKGSCSSLGVSSLAEICAAIETAARKGEPTDDLIPSLREAYEAIRPAIQALADGAPTPP